MAWLASAFSAIHAYKMPKESETTGLQSCVLGLLYINTKNCSLSIVLTATDQKPQKSLKR